jgi:hypothetical protein
MRWLIAYLLFVYSHNECDHIPAQFIGKGGVKLFPFDDYKIDVEHLDEESMMIDKYRANQEVFFSVMAMCRKTFGEQKLYPESFMVKTISVLIPPPVEAFTLWCLEDKYEVWVATESNKKIHPSDAEQKRQPVPSNAWTLKANLSTKVEAGVKLEGQTRYHEILTKVILLRKNQTSGLEMENKYMAMVVEKSKSKKKRKQMGINYDDLNKHKRAKAKAYDLLCMDEDEEAAENPTLQHEV